MQCRPSCGIEKYDVAPYMAVAPAIAHKDSLMTSTERLVLLVYSHRGTILLCKHHIMQLSALTVFCLFFMQQRCALHTLP